MCVWPYVFYFSAGWMVCVPPPLVVEDEVEPPVDVTLDDVPDVYEPMPPMLCPVMPDNVFGNSVLNVVLRFVGL